jgi:hypothetical protein
MTMNEFLKKYLLKFKTVNSVEVYQQQGEVYYHYSQLVMAKGQMNIEVQELALKWGELEGRLVKNLPLVVVLNVRGVLHKKLDGQTNPNQLITKVLPNANVQDFYVQSISANDGQVASLIRKDQLEQWIVPFLKAKLWLLDVRLGSFDAVSLLPFLREKEDFSTSVHDIIVEREQLQVFKKSSEQFEQRLLGDEYVNTRQLPSIGAAFRMMLKAPLNELGIEPIVEKGKEFFQFRLFQTAGWAVLIVFFVALLANYFAFTHYSDKNQNINAQLIYHQTALNKLDSLKQQAQQQSSFFKENSLTKSSKTSFYADRIASSMPYNIQLIELNIHPIQKKKANETDKQIEFIPNQIIIKGKANSSLVFNDWKRQLNNLDWVQSTNQTDYREEEGFGWFELEVLIKDKDVNDN